MNKKTMAIVIPILVLWGFILASGAGGVGIIAGAIVSFFYAIFIASYIDGVNEFKAKKHLADQFDKEKSK